MKSAIFALFTLLTLTSINLDARAEGAASSRSEVIANVSRNVILRTYEDFATSTAELKRTIDAVVANPTQANLEAAQNAWKLSRRSFELSEGFLFGPMDALGIDPMIDTWPLNLVDLKLILSGTVTIDTDFVRSLETALQGFHAIEYLLFGEGLVSNTKDIAQLTEREKHYLRAASELLVEHVSLLLYAWTKNYDPENPSSWPYIDVISRPGVDNPAYTTDEAVIQELVGGIAGLVTELGTAKLADPMGKTPEEADPRLEESPFSWNSINDFTHNVESVLNVYTGSHGGVKKGPGLEELVEKVNPTLAGRAKQRMLHCLHLVKSIPGPDGLSFGRAIRDLEGRKRIVNAIEALAELQAILENEIAPAVGKK